MKLVEMKGIVKTFWGAYANDHVDFDVEPGEVHALLGENGAGKTTLMNLLYALYQPDEGEILVKGQPACVRSPLDAIRLGIGMVHQHFMLVPTLTVSQNITLGLKEKGHPFTDRAAIDRRILGIARDFGLVIDPAAPVSSLSVGEQQRVEIMKLLYRDAKLLILDEPTAVLTPQEAERLFEVLRSLCARGCAVILITHRIPEVMRVADRVTVLRDTKKIVTAPISALDEEALARHMIGRALSPVTRAAREASEAPGLALSGVTLSERGLDKLRDVALDVRPGEIFGIAGVDGNGQKELAEVIAGIRRQDAGTVSLFGERLDGLGVEARRRMGVAYIPDDRHRDALVMDMDLTDNLLLRFNSDRRFQRRGLIDARAARDEAARDVAAYGIKTHALTTQIRYLSGGNQQKLILARELADNPKLVIACQPTRGLDVGATEFVQKQLVACKERGAAVLLISADLDEIRLLCDRFAVLHGGEVMGVVSGDEAEDLAKIGLMMAGRAREAREGGCV